MTRRREVWRIDRAGSLERLARREEDAPEPAAGEARIRVRAIGLNFADVFACLGLYSATPRGAFVPGLECAGVVEAVGPARPGALAVAAGDRVVAVTRFGAYATRVVADARALLPLPPAWSFAEGAAYPVQALTAWYGLLRLGGVAAGNVVLVHSAAGGVGLAALSIVEAVGARAIATVGSAPKREFLVRERGLEPGAVIVRDRRRFGAQLDTALEAAGAGGLDCVLDAVMGPFFRPAFERLRPEGRYVVYGAADFMARGARPAWARIARRWLARPRVDPLALVPTNRSVMGFNLIWLWDDLDRLPGAQAELARLLPRPPHVGARLPFTEMREAMRLLQSGETIGKVVVEVDER